MAVTKDFKCNVCSKEFELRISPNAENPKCPDCGNDTHWLPKLNANGHQFSYSLRVLCNGFDNKVHYQAE